MSDFMEKFKNEFGADIIKRGEDVVVETRSSGSIILDIALGGGYGKGRVVSSQGPESSGKSTIALLSIAQAQIDEPEKENMIIDLEGSYDPEWARLMGVDTDKLMVVQPTTSAGMVYKQIEYAINSKQFAIIVLDSVDGLVPVGELEEEDYDKEGRVGGTSKINSKAMRKIVYSGALGESGSTLIMIQQLRDDIGGFSMYGTPTTVTGGRSLRHAIAQRLEISVSDYHTEGSGKVDRKYHGQTILVRVTKNKVGPPRRVAEIDLYYEEGIDKIREMVKVAEITGVLPSGGGGWRLLQNPLTGEIFYKEGEEQTKKNEIKWQGEDRTYQGLVDDIENNEGKIYTLVSELVQGVLYDG